jgi:hypothetical protein
MGIKDLPSSGQKEAGKGSVTAIWGPRVGSCAAIGCVCLPASTDDRSGRLIAFLAMGFCRWACRLLAVFLFADYAAERD